MAWYITDGILQRADNAPAENSILTDITGEGDVVIPKGVTSISDEAFRGCRALTSIHIPEGVTSIGNGAFQYCAGLTESILPESVASIGDKAFAECVNLTNLNLPEGLTSIGREAFARCKSLQRVIIPSGISFIEADSFSYCSSLSEITLSEGITSFGNYAFAGCTSLTSIKLPESITSIPDRAFYYCTALTDITLPDGISSIGSLAFWECRNLASITLPQDLASIGEQAFLECRNLQSVRIPDSLTDIGEAAFDLCSSLADIIISENHPTLRIENNLLLSKDGTLLRCLADAESVSVPSTVTSIAPKAFSGCSRLTAVTVPEGITSIEKETFHDCTSLASITLPSTITRIGDWAFYKCSSLKHITLPEGVKFIGHAAFYECSDLMSIHLPDSVTLLSSSAFYHCPNLTKIALPIHPFLFLDGHVLKVLRAITCVISLKDAPANTRLKLCVGFALQPEKYPEELRAEYIAYIKKNAAKLASAAFGYPELLYLMCREKLIAAKNIDAFTEEAVRHENAELTAITLDYQNSLGSKEVTKARERKEKVRDRQDDVIIDRMTARADKVGIDGLNFVVTGGLTHFDRRNDLKAFIAERGGKLLSAMSAKTDYLITNDLDSGSVKNQKAADMGIVVISEEEFLKMAEGKKQ